MQRERKPKAKPHNFDTLIQTFELTTGGLPQLLQDEIEITSKQ